jgi:ribosomal protein L12E/L44/L45/RPP1/RPP2
LRPVLRADARPDSTDLSPLARAVAALADGERDVAAIAIRCDADTEAVFGALDAGAVNAARAAAAPTAGGSDAEEKLKSQEAKDKSKAEKHAEKKKDQESELKS